MKKMLILGVCLAAFLAVSTVSKADPYEMDRDTAALLSPVSWSDTFNLYYIGYNPGTAPADKIAGSDPSFGATMEYEVGFTGRLLIDHAGGQFASVNIGLDDAKALTGTFDSFILPISNDNNQEWEYKLYVNTTGTDYISSSWTSLNAGEQTTLVLPLGTGVNFATLEDIGFIVQFNKATTGDGSNLSDDFHTSIVPVPGAVLLGLLGISAAGLKLRRFA